MTNIPHTHVAFLSVTCLQTRSLPTTTLKDLFKLKNKYQTDHYDAPTKCPVLTLTSRCPYQMFNDLDVKLSIIPLTQPAAGVPHVIDDGHADRVIDHNLNNFWTAGELIWGWLLFVYIYEETTENFDQKRIMMSGGLDYSCTTSQNLQNVTVVIACRQMLHPINMLHGTLSYRRRMRFEFQIICWLQWNIFDWTLLLVQYSIFAALCHTVESELGLAPIYVYLRGKYRNFWSKRIMLWSGLDYSYTRYQCCENPNTRTDERRECMDDKQPSGRGWRICTFNLNRVSCPIQVEGADPSNTLRELHWDYN